MDYDSRRTEISFADRRVGRMWAGFVRSLPAVGLLLLGTLLLTLSFAPINQFYLAWVGLVPWLMVVRKTRNARTAFLWSWLAGLMFFTANMWWLWGVTGPGMVALMGMLGLYWAVPGMIVRGTGIVQAGEGTVPISSIRILGSLFAFAVLWTGFEWMRSSWPLNGLPWLYLGHTQSPIIAMCQVADITGVYGVSFWGAAVNGLIALGILNRRNLRPLIPAAAMVGGLTIVLLAYGVWRIGQTAHTTTPGPTVLVVQPNFPQSNTGDKGATLTEMVGFHIRTTRDALALRPDVDLVVWSETMMPDLNEEARRENADNEYGKFIKDLLDEMSKISSHHRAAILAGGTHSADFRLKPKSTYPAAVDRRNSAYLVNRTGLLSLLRYDKIHIVPFGEYLPFQSSIPPLYRLFVSLSPYGEEYTLRPGSVDSIVRFPLEKSVGKNLPTAEGGSWRFVTPICFEDIDPALVTKMFRGADGAKAADFIVNITNDGWFQFNEMPQHLQAALFRSIENRAPTARSVNTGISGFIDSAGRVHDVINAGTEGVSQQRLQIDSRYTFYTRHGDVFAVGCAIGAALLAIGGFVRWTVRKRLTRTSVLAA